MPLGWKGRAGKASFVCRVYSGNPVEGVALAMSPSWAVLAIVGPWEGIPVGCSLQILYRFLLWLFEEL